MCDCIHTGMCNQLLRHGLCQFRINNCNIRCDFKISNRIEAFKKSIKNFVEFKENLTGLMDLEIGGIDALVVDVTVANDNIKRSGKAFRILSEELAPEDGVRRGDLCPCRVAL